MADNIVENLIQFIPQVKGSGFQQLNKGLMSTHKNLFSLRNMFGAFFGYDLYSSVRNLIPELVHTSQLLGAMKSRFNAVSTSASAGADELNWVGEQSKRLGLDFLRTADDYSIFFATVSKNMGQGTTRKVFEQWAEAFRVLHIDPERQTRVLYALREMSSKGKIYMQDLALQLGSAVPDAMNIAAKSMGYVGPKAVERFRQAIKDGAIDVKKFIPLFSEAINKQYVSQNALNYAMEQTDAQLQLINTHWQFMQKKLLESGMQDDIVKFLKTVNKLLGFLEKHASGLYKAIKIIFTTILFSFGIRSLATIYLFTVRIVKLTSRVGLLNASLLLTGRNLNILAASKGGQFLMSIFGKGAVLKLSLFVMACMWIIKSADSIVKVMDKLGTFAEIFRIKMDTFLTDLEIKHPWLAKLFGKDETVSRIDAYNKRNPNLVDIKMEITNPKSPMIPYKKTNIWDPSYNINPYKQQNVPPILKVEKMDNSIHIIAPSGDADKIASAIKPHQDDLLDKVKNLLNINVANSKIHSKSPYVPA